MLESPLTWCLHCSEVCERVGALKDDRKPNIHGRLSVATGCFPPNLGVIFHTTHHNSPVSQSSLIWICRCALCDQVAGGQQGSWAVVDFPESRGPTNHWGRWRLGKLTSHFEALFKKVEDLALSISRARAHTLTCAQVALTKVVRIQ